MQRPSSAQSRGINSAEKRFIEWCKFQPSIVSGTEGVEVHHCVGSSCKTSVGLERVHIGHWFCIPLTKDEHWLYHNRKREFQSKYGMQNELWLKLVENYDHDIPTEVIEAITAWPK